MLKSIFQKLLLSKFVRREDGVIAIETMIMLPLMFLTFMALFTTFDAYRQYAMNQKAAYTISDMLSRETMAIDDAYIDGTQMIFEVMTRSRQQSSVRVTVVRFDGEENQMVLEWSESRGGLASRDNASVADWIEMLPQMVDGEEMIVVETWSRYAPAFRIGLGEKDVTNFIFTRPRYAPQIEFDDGQDELNS
ncbi:TadE/TadG family type IV pilus assembly protein [Sulfitobacter guttiformis]|uniref:Flp pilus assembly protein TadG n=1 Tax=Sulfitobacter guttiformis TaxID=74349 RepID=A0A420DJ32_9RHOB|nr:hypothetical protein [Sulfitobacter guttiformis]KIN71976.1 hypothetical protein Z949_1142 [Sulfitobacter guttiformis KCTC 32187]RKE94228.1 hypothetical protein C8N30_3346 [Sulfitobacter guttiformis]